MEVWVCRGDHGAKRRAVGQVEAEDTEALDQVQCRQVLERVLDHLQREPLDPAEPPETWSFGLGPAAAPASMEQAVYLQAAAFTDLHDLIHALVRATAQGAHGHRPWADEETPTGAAGATALALADRRWIPAYLQYLRECDLDHEVDQVGELDAIINAHGWGPDTCALAVARLGRCAGQCGEEQVAQWYEQGLADYLGTCAGREAFLAAARAEFDLPAQPRAGGNDARAKAQFEANIDFYLDELFQPYLQSEELEVLRAHAYSRWDTRVG